MKNNQSVHHSRFEVIVKDPDTGELIAHCTSNTAIVAVGSSDEDQPVFITHVGKDRDLIRTYNGITQLIKIKIRVG